MTNILFFMLMAGTQLVSPDTLYSNCTGSDFRLRMMCLGYIYGVADSAVADHAHPTICLPAETRSTELSTAVADYIRRAHDEHKPAAGFVSAALRDRYPCSP